MTARTPTADHAHHHGHHPASSGDMTAPSDTTSSTDTSSSNEPSFDTVIKDAAAGFDNVIAYSIDGTGNNLSDPSLGSANSDETRIAPANFAAGTTSTPVDGPNARVISNTIFANDANANDPGGRSAYMYAFGQFIDHDIDLNMDQTASPDGSNTMSITVPADDPSLPPGSQISIVRGEVDPANGNAVNSVTQYLDLSQVYGSDATTRHPCAMPTAR